MNGEHPLPDFKTSSWVYCPSWKLNIGCAPKCGQTSLHKVMEKNSPGVWHPNGEDAYSVWIVRDPVARFKSLWRDKCRNKAPLWADEEDAPLAGMSPEDLMDFIETTKEKDPHWTTQYIQCNQQADEIIILEKLDEWWAAHGLPKMTRKNKTRGPIDLSSELLRRVQLHYESDVFLYHEAL